MNAVTKPVPLDNSVLVQDSQQLASFRRLYLLDIKYLPGGQEATCLVRDGLSGRKKRVLASQLKLVSFSRNAYLLETTSTMGGNQ